MTDPIPERQALTSVIRRQILIPARPERVWHFLSTDDGWAAWWGPGSTIEARPSGPVHIRYPNGQTAVGEVIEIEDRRRLAFTFGYNRANTPLAPGASIVEIKLEEIATGTRVLLTHLLPDAPAARMHEAGWRYQLGLFGTLVSRDALGPDLVATIDAWHAAWAMTAPAERRERLRAVVTDDVVVSEPMATLQSIADVDAWISQVQSQMLATVRRNGPPALSGDLAVWDWVIESNDQPLATGRSVGRFHADGRMSEVAGFWLTGPPGLPTSVVEPDR